MDYLLDYRDRLNTLRNKLNRYLKTSRFFFFRIRIFKKHGAINL